MSEWKSFPAPQYKRVMVCGWQRKSGNVTGYWWWHEDNTDGRGARLNTGTPCIGRKLCFLSFHNRLQWR